MTEIAFSEAKMRRLKKAYDAAVKDGKTQFTFEGHELLVSYAKYLIEYLETQFPQRRG